MSRRPFVPQVLTANDLLSGDAVWCDATGDWVGDIASAAVFAEQASAEAALAQGVADAARVVGAYLAPVEVTQSGPRPTHFRETFRTRGPSNYAHGKQEQERA